MSAWLRPFWSLLPIVFLASCASPPRGLSPVTGFDTQRYLGKWYEIARYDHSFERGLTHVSANYSLRPDGKIEVWNQGYGAPAGAWKDIRGSAKSVGKDGEGSLLVTFFPPFGAGYHVIALDQVSYQWAVVAGPNRRYLWLLSRKLEISPGLRSKLDAIVEDAGYEPKRLIEVPQSNPPPRD
ncbi:MAG: lipocalin family protein [Verrucomicrobiae bacterium]|nr:lipocalin family protein [Verrucomicrobiae bacterium]